MSNIQNIHGWREKERVKGQCKEGAAGHEDRLEVRRRRIAELLPDASPESFGFRLFIPHLLELSL